MRQEQKQNTPISPAELLVNLTIFAFTRADVALDVISFETEAL